MVSPNCKTIVEPIVDTVVETHMWSIQRNCVLSIGGESVKWHLSPFRMSWEQFRLFCILLCLCGLSSAGDCHENFSLGGDCFRNFLSHFRDVFYFYPIQFLGQLLFQLMLM